MYHKPSMSTEKNDGISLLVVSAGNKEHSLEFTFLPWHRKDTIESTLRAIAILWVKSLIKIWFLGTVHGALSVGK